MKVNFQEISKRLNVSFSKNKEDYTEEEISKAFGRSLKTLRTHAKLSLNALSELVDIPNPTINRYENGINIPTITQALKLCSFFQVPVEIMIIFGLSENDEEILQYRADF